MQKPFGEIDRLLLGALVRRLRRSGFAKSPLLPLDAATLGLALGMLPYVRNFRGHLLDWIRRFDWLPGAWKREARWVEHWNAGDLSVYAERQLKLWKKDQNGKERWISWWVEVHAPERGPSVWPPGQHIGVSLRVGVICNGNAAAEIALERMRAALGVPDSARHPDFQDAQDFNPGVYDKGAYHEVWWRVPFDPMDLKGTEERLRAAMADQARRLGPLVDGGFGTIEIR